MTNTTPPDWVLIEAAKRSDWFYTAPSQLRRLFKSDNGAYRALCDMIAKYEQEPVDRKILCAREAMREACEVENCIEWTLEQEIVRAIELFEDGFGK